MERTPDGVTEPRPLERENKYSRSARGRAGPLVPEQPRHFRVDRLSAAGWRGKDERGIAGQEPAGKGAVEKVQKPIDLCRRLV